jgi:trimethylamine--corrinoid protein Co-methyltransferase
MRRGFRRNIETAKTLTDTQIESIHRGTLEVLEETGCRFESDRALKVLENNGCFVDQGDRIAKIPADLVEECIRRCPSSFMVRSREPENNLLIGGNTLYFMSSLGARLSDTDTGEVRVPTMEENNQAVIISDALDSIDLYSAYTPYFEIEGVEPGRSLSGIWRQQHRFHTPKTR